MMRDTNAVDVRFKDRRVGAKHFGDFIGRHILALPAIRIANAIREEPTALVIPTQHVAGAEPRVALFQNIAHDFAIRCAGVVEVALEF